MGRGSGNTRKSTKSNPNGLTNAEAGRLRKEEADIKREYAQNRVSAITSLQRDRATGKVGELVNGEIDKAIQKAENALKKYESINNISDVNTVETTVRVELRQAAARLRDMAKTHQANANDATGRVKNTYQKAADALYGAAHDIEQSEWVGGDRINGLSRLFEIFRTQNRWV